MTKYLSSSVWLLKGLTGSISGVLKLTEGKISFTSDEGKCFFNAPLSQVSEINFPWYYFGGGVKLKIGAEKYRISFTRPENLPNSEMSDLPDGIRACQEWKKVLSSHGKF